MFCVLGYFDIVKQVFLYDEVLIFCFNVPTFTDITLSSTNQFRLRGKFFLLINVGIMGQYN